MNRIVKTLLSITLSLGLITFHIPPASAVIQNITVVDSTGEPVRSTTVTIVFPPGITNEQGESEEERDTDPAGLLIFDFPGDGEYMIKYPGGHMTYVVRGGIPTYIKVGGTLIGLACALLIDLGSSWQLAFSGGAALLGFSASVLIGGIFGAYPALQAANISPVASLHG